MSISEAEIDFNFAYYDARAEHAWRLKMSGLEWKQIAARMTDVGHHMQAVSMGKRGRQLLYQQAQMQH